MDYYENLLRLYNVADPKGYSNLKKTSKRRDNVLLDSGHYSTQAWGALKKCWQGYKIAKWEWDTKKMEYYEISKGIEETSIRFSTTRFDR